MQTTISARHGHLSPGTQARITEKVEALRKFFDRLTAIEVTVDLEHADRPILEIRARAIVPLLAGEPVPAAGWKAVGDTALEVWWGFPSGVLRLVANVGPTAVSHQGPGPGWGRRLYALALPDRTWTMLPPWSVAVYLAEARR